MKEIYLIPGLGADRRVFNFLDLSAYSCHYVSWIDPLKGESIENYAARLAAQIKSSNPIIIGVSFGGMIAIEVAKQITSEKTILISSVRSVKEIHWLVRLFLKVRIHKILPSSCLKKPRGLLFYLFGVKKPVERELLADIIRDTEPGFLRWSIDKIVDWTNEIVPDHTTLIHGSNDKLFPGNHGDIIIPGGGHFMIVSKAGEVSNQLKRILN